MKIQCDTCRSVYNVNDARIPEEGAYVRCKKCRNRFFICRNSQKSEEIKEDKDTKKQYQENSFNNDIEDVVCSKCGQRQPNIHEQCFKCGFDFKHSKSGAHGKFFINKSIADKFGELSLGKIIMASSGILSVGAACLAGLYLLVNVGFSSVSGDLISIPVTENSYTYTHYNQEFVAWLKKNLWEDYEAFGHHSPQWDSKVARVLDKYAVYRLGFYDEAYGYDIQSDLENIINSGCNDPRLSYILGNVLFRNGGDPERAKAIVNAALYELEQSRYPAFYKFFAANKLILIYEKLGYDEDDLFAPLHEKKMRYLAQAAADDRFREGNQRFYFAIFDHQFEYNWGGRLPRALDQYMEEFDSLDDVDPWIDCMVRGRYHITQGWKARGGGYASKVTEEGWQTFHQEISTAEEYLVRAYEMHPEFPEAASFMIHIRMTSSGPLDEKEWFLRAVNAQFDFGLAYSIYLQAIRPRWGGSHESMMRFGNACLETERFDTKVPRMFLKTIRLISEDYPSGGVWVKPFQKRGVYKKIKKYFENALQNPREGLDYYKEYSAYAVYAWACGAFEDAKQIKSALGKDFRPEVSDEELSIKPSSFLDHLSST